MSTTNSGTVQNGARRLRLALRAAGVPISARTGVDLSYGYTTSLLVIAGRDLGPLTGKAVVDQVRRVAASLGLAYRDVSPQAVALDFTSRNGGRP